MLALTSKGRVGYLGAPSDLLVAFHAGGWADVMDRLSAGDSVPPAVDGDGLDGFASTPVTRASRGVIRRLSLITI